MLSVVENSIAMLTQEVTRTVVNTDIVKQIEQSLALLHIAQKELVAIGKKCIFMYMRLIERRIFCVKLIY